MHADVFCRVIDNFGDAGVAVRLARQLVEEHGLVVRLFIDQPEILNTMAPAPQRPNALTVIDWNLAAAMQPAALVIATFSCRLPAVYLRKMGESEQPPVWINLEYLSAEDWVESHHCLPSAQPAGGSVEHFFYPGFTEKTGGLLREPDAIVNAQPVRHTQAPLSMSLFAYPSPVIEAWIDALAHGAQRIELYLPHGAVTQALQLDAPRELGNVTLHPIAMQSQQGYDALLANCDFNVVRGEDSFVRAHWAGAPFLWHIYAQDEGAHLVKLDAWMTKFAHFVPTPQLKTLIIDFHRAWNTQNCDEIAQLWPHVATELIAWRHAVGAFRTVLCAQPDCATQLLEFAKKLGFELE